MNPEILLFDEITASLDPEMVREVLDVPDDKIYRIEFNEITAKAVKGKVVIGWRIPRTDGLKVSTEERQGATLKMTMPDCCLLTIEPILKEADDAYLPIQ